MSCQAIHTNNEYLWAGTRRTPTIGSNGNAKNKQRRSRATVLMQRHRLTECICLSSVSLHLGYTRLLRTDDRSNPPSGGPCAGGHARPAHICEQVPDLRRSNSISAVRLVSLRSELMTGWLMCALSHRRNDSSTQAIMVMLKYFGYIGNYMSLACAVVSWVSCILISSAYR